MPSPKLNIPISCGWYISAPSSRKTSLASTKKKKKKKASSRTFFLLNISDWLWMTLRTNEESVYLNKKQKWRNIKWWSGMYWDIYSSCSYWQQGLATDHTDSLLSLSFWIISDSCLKLRELWNADYTRPHIFVSCKRFTAEANITREDVKQKWKQHNNEAVKELFSFSLRCIFSVFTLIISFMNINWGRRRTSKWGGSFPLEMQKRLGWEQASKRTKGWWRYQTAGSIA